MEQNQWALVIIGAQGAAARLRCGPRQGWKVERLWFLTRVQKQERAADVSEFDEMKQKYSYTIFKQQIYYR